MSPTSSTTPARSFTPCPTAPALTIDRYVTILDLGVRGAVCTAGGDRRVMTTGAAAKRTKETIKPVRIYPPRSGNRREILMPRPRYYRLRRNSAIDRAAGVTALPHRGRTF
jgi:hypothetical protein